MTRRLTYILIFLLLGTAGMSAQTPVSRNWDEDIRALRRVTIPGFHCSADDYTQYSPAAMMLGLKVSGYKGRTGWGQMLTADALSIAIMSGVTQGMKHTIRRERPDNRRRNSFPSGHTGTAFLTATMLHKEYGWRSPWWSIGGYTVAVFTGISRIMNDRHWMSDVVAGAAVGIGAVHIGYWLSDLIFKDRYINPAYESPTFSYNPSEKHYVAETYFGRRFILGGGNGFYPEAEIRRGGVAGLSTDIPIIAGTGVTARIAANSLTYSDGTASAMFGAAVGGYHNIHFAGRLEFQTKVLTGPAWQSDRIAADFIIGTALGVMLDDNFKIKTFAEYEAIGGLRGTWIHSAVVGWGAAWSW